MPDIITIAQNDIRRGHQKLLRVKIAKLPSGTQIEIPIYVNRSKTDGPVLLLMAGLHGDEINGIEILRRIIDNHIHVPHAGSVICIPVTNIFGFINFSREAVADKDVNRSFPGGKSGSLASQLAFFLTRNILPIMDFGIDFHTGGRSRYNFPQTRSILSDPQNRELAEAFNAPFAINAPFRPKSLRFTAAKMGKRILVYEGGESLRFDERAISEGVEGTLRLMNHFGMRTDAIMQRKQVHYISRMTWIRAKVPGLFHAFTEAGNPVIKGQTLGMITDTLGISKTIVKASRDGFIIGLNNNPVVNQGDALINIGIEEKN